MRRYLKRSPHSRWQVGTLMSYPSQSPSQGAPPEPQFPGQLSKGNLFITTSRKAGFNPTLSWYGEIAEELLTPKLSLHTNPHPGQVKKSPADAGLVAGGDKVVFFAI